MAAKPEDANSLGTFAALWLRIGCLSFGGPAGQIALMHRELVEARAWLGEAAFLRALNFCMLLPGPEAQQLATWCGWQRRGVLGGVIAGGLFVLPGAVVMAALTGVYLSYGQQPLVAAVFFGIQAVVVAIVAQALLRLARRALNGALAWILASCAFALLWFGDAPFPLVVLAAGLIGWFAGDRAAVMGDAGPPISWRSSAATALLWTGIWLLPLAAAALWLGPDHALTQLGSFFARVAAFSFGGAYAAMAYVAQAAVDTHRWLAPHEMLAGLGLAETTPGPLVLVFQFVGGIAGHRFVGPWEQPWIGALLGMVLVLWMIFVPSFLWIFTAAPHLDRLSSRPGPARALAAITAAIVGVMANLALWFALHVLFHTVGQSQLGWLRLWRPTGAFDPLAAAIAVGALVLLVRLKVGIGTVLALGAAIGIAAELASKG